MIHLNIEKNLHTAEGDMNLCIDISIKKGEFTTLYGASGAGKTSILRMITGLLKADKGTITVDGTLWNDVRYKIFRKPGARNLGVVFQDYALFPTMSVRENLEFALNKGQSPVIIDELIQMVALDKLQHRKPDSLSGGQQQRVALARALVKKPSILLLDEPFSAVDLAMRKKLQDYILLLHKRYELTTIMISHDIGEIIKMSDNVYVLEKGVIVKQGTPMAVFTHQNISGKFQFTGEIIKIEKEDIIYVITLLIGNNIVKTVMMPSEIDIFSIGDKVMVVSKAFNPLIQKII
ncbi:MAG: molybdenum ABC transporter ATP-binding protein [Flavobacteriaceae bacterium]|nr:MAG: molybdenum ABC transporter ATP-binding protein [Flavobacteriaceae bacterium]